MKGTYFINLHGFKSNAEIIKHKQLPCIIDEITKWMLELVEINYDLLFIDGITNIGLAVL